MTCLQISSVVKYSDSHLWLEAADGSALRIYGSKVFMRSGWLGDEEVLNASDSFETANSSTAVAPMATFDLVVE
eukprot:g22618.t1